MSKNKCPECGGKAVVSCKCLCSQSECENGHIWHKCMAHDEPMVVMGERDHGLGISECSCHPDSFDGFGCLK